MTRELITGELYDVTCASVRSQEGVAIWSIERVNWVESNGLCEECAMQRE